MRIALVALFLLYGVGAFAESQPPTPSRGVNIQNKNGSADQSTQKSTYKQPGTEEMPLIIKGFPTAESENDTAYKKYEQQEKPTLDRWLTWGTVALAIFTFLLFCFTAALWWVTYRLSKDARKTSEVQARDTQASLAIAKESADLAKASFDSYRMAERAWVSFISVNTNHFTEATDSNRPGEKLSGYMFQVIWQNAGKTPAIRCRLYLEGRIVPVEAEGVPIFEKEDTLEQKESTLIPGITVSTGPWHLVDTDFMQLRNKKVRVFIYSLFEYTDVFAAQEQRLSETCIEVSYDGMRSDSVPNFRFVPIGPQNSAN